jgi:hypothetical protein
MFVWVKNVPDQEKDSRVSHLFLSLTAAAERQSACSLTRGII